MTILFNFIFIFASFMTVAFFIGGSFARLFAYMKKKYDKDADQDDIVVAKKVSLNMFLSSAAAFLVLVSILITKFLCQVIGII